MMAAKEKPGRMSKQEFLERMVARELPIDQAIARLTEELHAYEKKYNLRSEVFYRLIVGTPAEDHPDFISWAICYRSYFRTLQAQLSTEGVLPGGL